MQSPSLQNESRTKEKILEYRKYILKLEFEELIQHTKEVYENWSCVIRKITS